jgi:hypothetical protein
MVHGEPLAGPPEPAHHLVGDHHDAVARAEITDALQVPLGRDQDAVRAGHRLEDERRDRLGPLELEGLLEQAERRRGVVDWVLGPVPGVQHVHDPAQRGLVRPPARIARERHHRERRPVVRAVAAHDLVPARREASHLDGVLVRLCSAEGEERLLEVAGPELRELLAEARSSLERVQR